MSAKSCTFAAEIVETMSIEEMTHTAWRCRHSYYFTQRAGMLCRKCVGKEATDRICSKCSKWQPSELAEDFFSGALKRKHDPRAETLAQIYTDRKKRGTF